MMKPNAIIFILILGNSLLLSCKKIEPLISFKDKRDVAKISFEYSSAGHMVTECNIRNDTFKFVFDTGANMSIISPKVIPDDFIGRVQGIDIHNETGEFKICKLKSMRWGEVNIENLVVVQVEIPFEGIDGIIGRDLLSKFCIKIDNENKEILCAKKSNMIDRVSARLYFVC